MKKYILFALLLATAWMGKTQSSLIQQSGHMTFGDATIVIHSDTVQFAGNIDSGTSKIVLSGGSWIHFQSGDDPLNEVEINQPPGAILELAHNMGIKKSLFFLNPYNKVMLGDHDLVFSDTASGVTVTEGSFIVTNGNGQMKKAHVDINPFAFPVGYDTATFNPLIIAENGTPDTIGVRVLEHAFTEGGAGTPFSAGVVDASWEITEATPGGMDLELTAQWAASDELSGFDRAFSGNGFYDVGGWDLTVDDCAPATGTDPFTRQRTGITEPGAFAVGNDSVATVAKIDINLFLSGPYSGSGLMDDGLRSGGHLPTGEPFDGLGFTHYGFGGGETVASTVFDVTGPEAIVDWVLVEVRDGSDSSVIKSTTPALLQRDGDIVGLDGFSSLSLPGIGEADYWVVIKHRNHLGVMSAGKISLSESPVPYDFTLDPADSFGGTNAIGDLGDGFFGLFPGDFNHNGQVQNTDVTGLHPSVGNSGYKQGDFDLNSQVQNVDLQLELLPNVGKGVQFPNN